jgi:hypothetical protein
MVSDRDVSFIQQELRRGGHLPPSRDSIRRVVTAWKDLEEIKDRQRTSHPAGRTGPLVEGPAWTGGGGGFTGPCPCECNSGGFCGGCGHAGCGGRR